MIGAVKWSSCKDKAQYAHKNWSSRHVDLMLAIKDDER